MKMKAIIVLLAVSISCVLAGDNDAFKEWQIFQEKFGKSYKSPIESKFRFSIFQQNLKDIKEHNERFENGEVTWTKGINQFSDWTKDEFVAYVNKYKLNEKPNFPLKTFDNLTDSIPSSIDWRQYGAVSVVKNQGQCGSCWSFSATGSIEGQYRLRKNSQVLLSEQNLVDCCTATYGYQSAGCNGGAMLDAFNFVKINGIETESQYPYEARDGRCRQTAAGYKIDTYYSVQQSENALLQAVATIGPISVAIEATDNLQSYSGGILYDYSCSNQLNHGVLVVGYGTLNGQDYWIIKNSWGASWGEAGFFRLSRINNNCGTQNMASFPYFNN